jgi:hypothetical protein
LPRLLVCNTCKDTPWLAAGSFIESFKGSRVQGFKGSRVQGKKS